MEAEQAEVRALEAEIAVLRQTCEQLPAPWGDASRVRKSFQEIQQSGSAGQESSKDMRSHLRHLESELSFLSMLTGFTITDYSKKTKDLTTAEMTEEGVKKVLQRHRLSGNCNIVTFQLEFQILETQNKENISCVITDLGIIMELTEYSELCEFVSRAEEKRDLFMFFRGLHSFVKWYEYRKRTFTHFKDKYPDTVHLPEGPSSRCMGIRGAGCPGFELVIVWRIHVDTEGKVLPQLDLLPRVPQRALQLDRHRVVDAAPLSFRSLLGALGIEGAVETLIQSLQ